MIKTPRLKSSVINAAGLLLLLSLSACFDSQRNHDTRSSPPNQPHPSQQEPGPTAAIPVPAIAPAQEAPLIVDKMLPTHADVMRDLYGLPGKEEPFAMEGSTIGMPSDYEGQYLASIWFRQSITMKNNTLHVVFIQLQAIDPSTGKPFESHAQPAFISSVTYRSTPNGWAIVSRQPKPFAELGSWGTNTQIHKVQQLHLTASLEALLTPASYSGQGEFSDGFDVVAFDGKEWAHLGYIATGGSNSGSCDDEGAQEDLPPESISQKCWHYTGSIAVQSVPQRSTPNLVSLRTGTEDDGAGGIRPARDAVYEFKNDRYIDPNEPL